jgi:glutamyl-tRNA(Gln) amidotransferase subunit D
MSEYSADIIMEMKKQGIRIGDHISIEKDGQTFFGMLMPKSQGSANSLIIKLDNGYNAGVDFKGAKIKKEKAPKSENPLRLAVSEKKQSHTRIEKFKPDGSKPIIAILSTGGTVASRIDYKTGAVTPLETPEDIITAIPELASIVNIKARKVFQMFSEDMEPYHWITLAKKIEDEIETGVDGIIITHGTDTMHYTSAALSLMVQNSPIPIILVGSQRSSDRGSSDAAMNMLCAAQFIAKSGFSGVALCMHGSTEDKFCFVHDGVHTKKTHTSRRDAFKSIDVKPIARVEVDGTLEILRSDYKKKDKKRKVHIVDRFENKVALVKIYPGFDSTILENLEKSGYRGIVIEGTGLGHAPINVLDEYTKNHAKLLTTIQRMSKTVIIAMTSQCNYGKVNMNVYSTGRALQEAGVLEARMTPETAFVKLGWSLGHTKIIEDAKKLFLQNVAGEILDRVEIEAFE